MKLIDVLPSEIEYVLDYVRPEHRYITSARIGENDLICEVKFSEPEYMKPPVGYLNSSVLLSVVAEAGHLLAHMLLKNGRLSVLCPMTTEKMAILRSMEAKDYSIELSVRKVKRFKGHAFMWIDFSIPAVVNGSVTCLMPMEGG
jgi:hypothetical protein